jgi:signal transduction histidine kinase
MNDHDRWARTTLLRRVAHDLVGGAGVTRGALDELERTLGAIEADQAVLLGIARRSVAKIERMARRLRLVGLAEAGELQLARAPIDLRSVVDAAVAEAAELDGRRTVRMERDPLADSIPIDVDADLMRVAISELVANALRFARSRAAIEERIVDCSANIVVQDDGPGFVTDIGAELRPRLRHREGQHGTGVSLPVVADIVGLHGGHLELGQAVWPEGARGARVSIVLPLRQD